MKKASANPILVMVDEESGGRFARMTRCKGLGEHGSMDWLLQEISRTWKSWGHTGGPEQQLIVKSDGEPALVAVCEAAIKYHGGKAIQERPAKGQKAENGLIEAAGKDTRELFCSFLTQVEEGTKESLPLDNNLVPWMIRWAAICYSRYAIGRDGRTAFERIRGRSCRAVVVPIGEEDERDHREERRSGIRVVHRYLAGSSLDQFRNTDRHERWSGARKLYQKIECARKMEYGRHKSDARNSAETRP